MALVADVRYLGGAHTKLEDDMSDKQRNRVTSLELSKELSKFITVETAFVWVGKELHVRSSKGLPMSLITGHQVAIPFDSTPVVPAYDIADLLEWLPRLMTVKARKRTGNEVVYPAVMNGGRRGKGTVGLMSFEGHVYSWYKRIPVEVNLPQALAKLAIWVNEGGHSEVAG